MKKDPFGDVLLTYVTVYDGHYTDSDINNHYGNKKIMERTVSLIGKDSYSVKDFEITTSVEKIRRSHRDSRSLQKKTRKNKAHFYPSVNPYLAEIDDT